MIKLNLERTLNKLREINVAINGQFELIEFIEGSKKDYVLEINGNELTLETLKKDNKYEIIDIYVSNDKYLYYPKSLKQALIFINA